jgi:hypothetical protein
MTERIITDSNGRKHITNEPLLHKPAPGSAHYEDGDVFERIAAKKQQPAQQEPVTWKHDCAALLQNDVELWVDRCPHCGKPRTTPQAQPAQSSKPWVGLTPDDIRGLCANTIPSTWDISLCRLVEKFLKEKNT